MPSDKKLERQQWTESNDKTTNETINETQLSSQFTDVVYNMIYQFYFIHIYTGWLKLKYPTEQNAISRQPCEIFIPTFLSLYGRDPATILILKKNYFSFLQSNDYINILCHIFNSARNNQQQLVIFMHVIVSVGICFGAFNSKQDQSEC